LRRLSFEHPLNSHPLPAFCPAQGQNMPSGFAAHAPTETVFALANYMRGGF